MADEAKEIVIPDCTFGINQVFTEAFDSGWRTFPGHYLLYASTGVFQLEVGNVRWLLPPQRARLIDKPSFAEVASAVHVSERILARRFTEETGMTGSQFAHRARMIRAMELLADPHGLTPS